MAKVTYGDTSTKLTSETVFAINKVPISRVEIAVAMIMNEAIARGHKENGGGYTPSCRLMSLLMDINEEVTRGINERMNAILKGEQQRALNHPTKMAGIA